MKMLIKSNKGCNNIPPLQKIIQDEGLEEIQLTLIVSNSVDSNFRLSRIFIKVPNFVVYKYI
jgi:hypothetical protein